jgi:hypothetical protein
VEAIHTSTHDDSSSTANETSDKITEKTGNEMRQTRTHTWAPDTSHKLKSLQDLSIRVNPEVTEEVIDHAGLRVDGSLHLCLHVCKVIHPSLESSDPFHRALSLVNPITDVPLQRSVPVRVPGRGGGSGSEARLGVIVSLRCSRGLLCCLQTSSPVSVRWSCEAVARLSHPIKLQCKTFTRI